MLDSPAEYYEKHGKHYVRIDYPGIPTEGLWYHGRRGFGTYHRKVTSKKLAEITPLDLTRGQLAVAEHAMREVLTKALAINAYMFRDKWAFDEVIEATLEALAQELAKGERNEA